MLTIFLGEWQHFSRNRFKLLAACLFLLASLYGLYNGQDLYTTQMAESEKIKETIEESKAKTLAWFENGEKGPKDRPFVNIETPYWALSYTPVYEVKTPSPMMVYGVGQAEQYAYYKQITSQASPYDADMAEEIANPERLQLGALDFSFMILFLLPLLLLIFLYNIKGSEMDMGIIKLVYAQAGSPVKWLLSRTLFYVVLAVATLAVLMLAGAFMTPVLTEHVGDFFQLFLLFTAYILFWSFVFFLVLYIGRGSTVNALSMVSLWLLLAFVIPGAVHQWVSLQQPPGYMTELIDAKRDDLQEIYDQPQEVLTEQLFSLFPQLQQSPVAQDSAKISKVMRRSLRALGNNLMKSAVEQIEANNQMKNDRIAASYWFNPITFFQNQVNKVTQTHYQNYQDYRNDIQQKVDETIELLVLDTWSEIQVDKERYLEYNKKLSLH